MILVYQADQLGMIQTGDHYVTAAIFECMQRKIDNYTHVRFTHGRIATVCVSASIQCIMYRIHHNINLRRVMDRLRLPLYGADGRQRLLRDTCAIFVCKYDYYMTIIQARQLSLNSHRIYVDNPLEKLSTFRKLV